jgi:hypothetical protein
MADKQTIHKILVSINGTEVKNNLATVGKTAAQLNRELRNLENTDPSFNEKVKQLRTLNGEYKRMRSEITGIPTLFDKIKGAIGGLGTALSGYVAISSIFSAVGKGIQVIKDFDLAMSEFAGVTGMAKSELGDMKQMFIDLSTQSQFTAVDIAKAGVELSKLGFSNEQIKESFDQIILGATAFGSEIPAVAELSAATMNAFGLEAKDTDRIMNVLAASANKTAAGFDDFQIALPKFAAASKALNVSLEESSALFGLLRDNGIRAESGGVAIRNLFLKSAEMGLTYSQALDKVAKSYDPVVAAGKMFGSENATQVLVLAKNRDKIKEYTAAVTNQGNALQDLADKKMDSLSGQFKKLSAAWDAMILSADSGNGVLSGSIKWLLKLGVTLLNIINPTRLLNEEQQRFTEKVAFVGKLIGITLTALVSYKTALALIELWNTRATASESLKAVAQNASRVATIATTAASILYYTALGVLTFNLGMVSRAMTVLKLTMLSTPFGAVAALVGGAVAAYYLFSKSTSQAAANQRAFNDTLNEAKKQTASERLEIEKLFKIAKDETNSKKERLDAIKKMNEISPEHLKFLNLENINTKMASEAVKAYTKNLLDNARAKAIADKITSLDQEKSDIEKKSLSDFENNPFQRLSNSIFGKSEYKTLKEAISAAKKLAEEAKLTGKEYDDFVNNARSYWIDNANRKTEELNTTIRTKNKLYSELLVLTKKGMGKDPVDPPTEPGLPETNKEKEKHDYEADRQKAIKELRDLEFELENEKLSIRSESEQKELDQLKQSHEKKKSEILFAITEENSSILKLKDELAKTTEKTEKAQINALLKEKESILEAHNKKLTAVEDTYLFNKGAIVNKYKLEEFNKKELQNSRLLKILQTNQNNELASIGSLEDAKKLLKEKYGVAETSKIKTLEEGITEIKKQQNLERLEQEKQHLEELVTQIEATKNDTTQPLDEATQSKLQEIIDEYKLKLSELGVDISNINLPQDEKPNNGQDLSKIDVFGFSAKQLEDTYDKLDTEKEKLEAVATGITLLSNAWDMFYQANRKNAEAELNTFNKAQNGKKKALLDQLNKGIISQAQYKAKMEQLDEESKKKEAEIKYKQAKEDHKMRLRQTIANVASNVITSTMNAGGVPFGLWAGALALAQGALQIAAINANKPEPPSFFMGGPTNGLGFTDNTGHEVAGIVHANEYVIPKWLRQDPQIARMEKYIEAKRQGKPSFMQGGETSVVKNDNFSSTNMDYGTLVPVLNKMSNFLELLERNGVIAYLSNTPREIKELRRQIEQQEFLEKKVKKQ